MSDTETVPINRQKAQHISAQSSFAIMQSDMDAALQKKQRTDAEKLTSDDSNNEPSKVVESADSTMLLESQHSRVIEMAWEDRTPFAAIEYSYGLDETAVIKLMRQALKPSSFRLWRERVTGRDTKHQAKRGFEVGRAYCKTQYKQR